MTKDPDKEQVAGAARLRTLRLSLGYETAASFARAIGWHPDRYRRYERVFFCNGGPLAQFVHALKEAGFDWIDLHWLLFGKPTNIGSPSTTREKELLAMFHTMPAGVRPLFIRLGIRLLNGVLIAKAKHLFWQEVALQQATEAGRAQPWPQ